MIPATKREDSQAPDHSGKVTSAIQTAKRDGIPWGRLSPKALTIALLVAAPISEGYKQNEVARLLGKSPEWVSESLVELKCEIVELLEARD